MDFIYENYGGKESYKILNTVLSRSGATISGKIIAKNPFNHNPLDDKNMQQSIETLSDKFYNDIKNKTIHPFQNLRRYIVFNIGIKPFVIKHKDKYTGVIEHHWKKRGIIK